MIAAEAPPYDVRDVSPPFPPGLVLSRMSLTATAAQLATLAAEGGEHGGNHESLNAYVIGGGALFALLLLLWITTRFNRDR